MEKPVQYESRRYTQKYSPSFNLVKHNVIKREPIYVHERMKILIKMACDHHCLPIFLINRMDKLLI